MGPITYFEGYEQIWHHITIQAKKGLEFFFLSSQKISFN
jgi:hypothetical protein